MQRELITMEINRFLHSIHWFRGLAITFIVLIHINRRSLEYFFDFDYLGVIVGNSTFFFVFISGYLFWHLKDKYKYSNFLKVKLKNVISPYVIISLLTMILIGVVNNYKQLPWIVNFHNVFEQNGILWHLLTGRSIVIPFWFLPVITIFFITSKLIKEISESSWFYVIFIISILYSFSSKRPTNIDYLYPILMYVHFFGIYLFGIACKKNEQLIINNSKVIALVSLPLYILMIWFKSNKIVVAIYLTDSFINFDQLMLFFAVLFYFSVFIQLEKRKFKFKLLELIAKYSFGIFFLHWYFIFIFSYIFYPFAFLQNFGLEYILIFVLSVSCSILSCKIIKYITGEKSRYFIGC